MDCRPDLLPSFCCCFLGRMFSSSCLLSSCLPFFMSNLPASIFSFLPVWQTFCLYVLFLTACRLWSPLCVSTAVTSMPTHPEHPCLTGCSWMWPCRNLVSCRLLNSSQPVFFYASCCWLWVGPVFLICYDLIWTCLNRCFNYIMFSSLSDWLHSLAKL